MEGLERLVSESFARHRVETAFDHRRLQWSPWFRCVDSVSLVQLSSKPGLFALADEVVPSDAGSQRMPALLRICEADDLGMALGRLFLPRNPASRTPGWRSLFCSLCGDRGRSSTSRRPRRSANVAVGNHLRNFGRDQTGNGELRTENWFLK